ncbi:MAG: calcium-binding protein [Pseudomonadota bacterium]
MTCHGDHEQLCHSPWIRTRDLSTPGDSGSPTLINGQIAGIVSGGASPSFTDIDDAVNSSFGEIAFDTRVSFYADWIDSVVGSSLTVNLPPGTPLDGTAGTGTISIPDDTEPDPGNITNPANDLLFAASSGNVISAGNGQDTIVGNNDFNIIYGNQDEDLLFGNGGTDVLYGGQDLDVLYGGTELDFIYGNKGDDILYGNQGLDILYGGQGNDVLYGGQGSDGLQGGVGDDRLIGNAGGDVFVIRAGGGTDVIVDYNGFEGDGITGGVFSLGSQAFVLSDGNGVALVEGDQTLILLGVTLTDPVIFF